MELGKLRAAIRSTKGNPKIVVPFGGKTMTFALQKTPLLAELEAQFPGGKAAETGLSFDADTGELFPEHGDLFPKAPVAPSANSAGTTGAKQSVSLLDEADDTPSSVGLLV